MALTVLRIPMNNEKNNLAFQTSKSKDKLICKVIIVDDLLNQIGQAKYLEILVSEEDYHTELRKSAAEKQQLLTSHSTNPEWNPKNYQKKLEDDE